jgi:hypothetical protein
MVPRGVPARQHYLIERYPLMAEAGLGETEVRESLEMARALVERLRA